MSIPSPTPSMIASTSTISREIDDSVKNMFKNFKTFSKLELANVIVVCKEMVEESEEMSMQRKWLIRKLIELRFRLAHINALSEDINADEDMTVSGHNFKIVNKLPSKRIYCDYCTNTIWIFQHSCSCLDCFFIVHLKCLKYVTRPCMHTIGQSV